MNTCRDFKLFLMLLGSPQHGDIEEDILNVAMAKRTEFPLAFDAASNFGRDGEIMK